VDSKAENTAHVARN